MGKIQVPASSLVFTFLSARLSIHYFINFERNENLKHSKDGLD